MRRLLALALLAGLARPSFGSDVQVQGQGQGPSLPGQAGAGISLGPGLGPQASLAPGLAPSLLPALQVPLSPTVKSAPPSAPAAIAVSQGAPSAVSPAVVLSAPLSAPAAVAVSQGIPSAVSPAVARSVSPAVAQPTPSLSLPPSAIQGRDHGARPEERPGAAAALGRTEAGGRSSGKSLESSAQAGGALFDGSAEKRPSLLDTLRSFLRLGDKVPQYPGQPGQKLRIGGRSFALGRRVSETPESVVYNAEFDRDYTVRLLKPGSAMERELSALRELSDSGIPHADLIALSEDGRVWVQRLMQGDTAAQLSAKKGWRRNHLTALADLSAALIARGRTADLSPGNLVYEHWRSQWSLASAKGYSKAGPGDALAQVLSYAQVEPAEFLSALRGRLGPDSEAWARLRREPAAQAGLAALARLDASRPPGPRLRFSSAPRPGALDDSLASRREMSRRLGYDAFSIRERRMLHTDDPGKLNTRVFSVLAPDGKELVGKVSSAGIIRNELFLRKVVHRWFGEYFQAPWSLASLSGDDSAMLMEMAEGSRAYAKPRLSLRQRVALGVLMRGFGVSDVNPGNVLYSEGDRVALIDFEQALSRATPVPNRIPDPGILLELPWVNGGGLRIEDFQPGIRDWRALLDKPETQAELARMLAESGFQPPEIPPLLERIRRNAADLDWTLQCDIDFADGLEK